MNYKKGNVGFLVVILIAVVLAVVSFVVMSRENHPEVSPVGAIPGSDIPGPGYSVNGQFQFKYHDTFNMVGSTTCSRLSPSATSSLGFFSANVSSSSPNATIYELGTAAAGGADPFATTTLIGTKFSVGAAAGMSITGSTTPTTVGSVILAPNTRVNFKGGSPTVFPKGTCNFTFNVF